MSRDPLRSGPTNLGASNLVELLAVRSEEAPEAWAYRFLGDDGEVAGERTWGGLARRAWSLAARLEGLEGERALLLLPPGLDFIDSFLGCLAAGVVAVPSYPPTSRRSVGRVRRLLEDARPRVALITSALLDRLRRWGGVDEEGTQWLVVDELTTDPAGSGGADGWRCPELRPEQLAFLQYTSGSTSTPKGVMVSHGNLWHNQEVIRRACDHGPDSVFVSWLPLYHDLGLIGNVLQNLYVGSRCVIMAPVTFLQRPAIWLEAVSRFGATTSGGPNFAYELCLRRVPEEDRQALDLSTWRVAFNGAEPVRAETLRRFAAGFAAAGLSLDALYPCYGLAEATLMVSGGRPRVVTVAGEALQRHEVRKTEQATGRDLVSCGPPLPGQEVVIADPETAEALPAERVGEVWIAGPSVAGGYWQRQEETGRAFGARLADGRGPYLRSGDLGFLDEGGELFITGRLKDLIIVRGRNHYPSDLELTAGESHPDLRAGGGAAFTVLVEGEERAVLVHELERHHGDDLAAVTEAVRRAVAEEHELQLLEVVLIRAAALPKTTSGKVQRRACRQLYLDDELAVLFRDRLERVSGEATGDAGPAPREVLALPPEERPPALEALLRSWVADILRVDPERLPVDRALTGLGLDSLAAVELTGRMEEGLGVGPGFSELLGGTSIRRLARRLAPEIAPPERAEGEAETAEEPVELPLAPSQQPMWFLYQLDPGSPAYNVSVGVRLGAASAPDGVESAVTTLVERHAALRTRFGSRDGEPVQRIEPPGEILRPLERVDATAWDRDRLEHAVQEAANRPLDLAVSPFAPVLFGRSGGSLLLLTFHHVVMDGYSLWRVLEELAMLLGSGGDAAGRSAGRGSLGRGSLGRGSLRTWLDWQRRLLAGPAGRDLDEFWRRRLGDAGGGVLELVGDRPRGPWRRPPGASFRFALGAEPVQRARQLARERGATLGSVVLAAWLALLHRYSGRRELVVGTALAGRTGPGAGELVGCLFNLLPVRSGVTAGTRFVDLLEDVQEGMVGALDHQAYPAQRLRQEVEGTRGEGPFFPVTFLYQAPPEGSLAATADGGWRLSARDGSTLDLVAVERRAARADLELEVVESEDRLDGWLHFNHDLWERESVADLARSLCRVVESAVADPTVALDDLALLTPTEVDALTRVEGSGPLARWSGRPPVAAFRERVREAPDAVAVVHRGATMTYRELDGRSAQLANLIRRLGK